jgi:CBS-domain-containing membrane protein
MTARDVMVSPVATVTPSTSVQEVAKMLLERRISAVPVVDDGGKIVGIISEADLMHRAEAGTERQRPRWLSALMGDEPLITDYVKARARLAADVMTRNVVTASPDTPLRDVAMLLEKNAIKRVPITENGQLVGIVSRANLIQAVASDHKELVASRSDAAIRERLLTHLKQEPWAHPARLNIIVTDGVVDLWGTAQSETERTALRVAAESTPGVRAVNDHLLTQRIEGWF